MIILLIVFWGLILRLVSLNQSLWLDEAINVLATKNYSLWKLITVYSVADFHPPGYSILLWFWTKIFGYGEISVRIPSVIFGISTIFIIYLIGKQLKNSRVGLLAALLLVVNPLHIYYSQEARPYAFATFAVSLSYLFFVKLINKRNVFFWLVISYLLLFLSDYVAFLIIPAQLLFLVFTDNKQLIKKWLGAILLGLLGVLWWIPIFIQQFSVGTYTAVNLPAWSKIVGSSDIKSIFLTYIKFIIGRVSFYNKFFYAEIILLPTLISLGFLCTYFIKGRKYSSKILFFWLTIPPLLALLISIKLPIYSYFRVLFILPVFLLILVNGLEFINKKVGYTLFILFFVFELSFSLLYLIKPEYQREDWRGAVSFLEKNNVQKVVFESDGPFPPFTYYSNNKIKGLGGLLVIPGKSSNDVLEKNLIPDSQGRIYLFNYLVDITDPKHLVNSRLRDLGYHQKNIYNFNGVGFIYEYSQ